jgi:hypothetical protein
MQQITNFLINISLELAPGGSIDKDRMLLFHEVPAIFSAAGTVVASNAVRNWSL